MIRDLREEIEKKEVKEKEKVLEEKEQNKGFEKDIENLNVLFNDPLFNKINLDPSDILYLKSSLNKIEKLLTAESIRKLVLMQLGFKNEKQLNKWVKKQRMKVEYWEEVYFNKPSEFKNIPLWKKMENLHEEMKKELELLHLDTTKFKDILLTNVEKEDKSKLIRNLYNDVNNVKLIGLRDQLKDVYGQFLKAKETTKELKDMANNLSLNLEMRWKIISRDVQENKELFEPLYYLVTLWLYILKEPLFQNI